MSDAPARRGDVYLSDLAPRSGSEQTGRRPVIVISADGFNLTRAWRSLNVIPVSASPRGRGRGPSAVALARGAGGLDVASVAVCHQITTVDRAKLVRRLGALDTDDFTRIEDGIRAALDMP